MLLWCGVKWLIFGDTLSHSALLGVALGIFLQINPYVAIVILTIILAVLMVWLESNTQFSVDTLLGIIAHSCLSLGVVTVGLLKNVRVDLMSYLFGDLLAINFNDLPYIAAGVIIVLGTLLYFWQALLSTTVSPELAQVEGINIKKNAILFLMIFDRTDDRIKYEVCRGPDYYIAINYSSRNSKTFCQNT